jgi:hypothetical protein
MSHLLTTFFWNNAAFSGAGQLNIGPFFVGFVNKFFRAEVRGQVNYQGVVLGSASVQANFLAWGVQQVPHTTAALDVITSADSDTWFVRRQSGTDDSVIAWAPSTNNAAVLVTNETADDWAGQLAIGANQDVFISFKTSTGAALSNFNTFGTVRLWWG